MDKKCGFVFRWIALAALLVPLAFCQNEFLVRNFSLSFLYDGETIDNVSVMQIKDTNYYLVNISGRESLFVFSRRNETIMISDVNQTKEILKLEYMEEYDNATSNILDLVALFNTERKSERKCKEWLGIDKRSCLDYEAGGTCYKACAPLPACYDSLLMWSFDFLKETYNFNLKSEELTLSLNQFSLEIQRYRESNYSLPANDSYLIRAENAASALSSSKMAKTISEGGFEFCEPITFNQSALQKASLMLGSLTARNEILKAKTRAESIIELSGKRVEWRRKNLLELQGRIEETKKEIEKLKIESSISRIMNDDRLNYYIKEFNSQKQDALKLDDLQELKSSLEVLKSIKNNSAEREGELKKRFAALVMQNNECSELLLRSKNGALMFKKLEDIETKIKFPLTENDARDLQKKIYGITQEIPPNAEEMPLIIWVIGGFAVAGLMLYAILAVKRRFGGMKIKTKMSQQAAVETTAKKDETKVDEKERGKEKAAEVKENGPEGMGVLKKLESDSDREKELREGGVRLAEKREEIKRQLESVIAEKEGHLETIVSVKVNAKGGDMVADGTQVGFSATQGEITPQTLTKNGVAYAILKFSKKPEGDVFVIVTAKDFKRKIRLPF